MGYPSHSDAVEILKGNADRPINHVKSVLSVNELIELRKKTNDMFVHDEIYEYIVSLVEATRTMDIFSMGASPRGTIALLRMAKAMAVISGRDYVTALDVQSVTKDTLGHRVKLSARAKANGFNIESAVKKLIESVPAPRN